MQPQTRAGGKIGGGASGVVEVKLGILVKWKARLEGAAPFLMFMNSPIAHLTQVLQKVRESAQTYSVQLKSNEAATRAALIDPVLRSLGWDVADPSRVLVEKTQTVQGKSLRVDYALLHGEKIKIVVEAKKLGGNLQDQFLQLVTYAFGLNVEDIWVSDGAIWRHYQTISSADTNPTKEFDLTKDDLPLVAAYFVQHMDVALVSPQIPVIDELNDRIETLENLVWELKQSVDAKNKPASTPIITVPTTTVSKPPAAIAQGVDNWYSIDGGAKTPCKKAVDATVNALRALAKASDEILPEIEHEMELQLANRKTKVVKRRWIAQTKEALYQNPKLWVASVEIVPGWWLGTNYSNGDKRDMLATAAKVAAKFGVKLESHLV